MERIEAALGGGSALVVLGAPGVGKTRIALEVARRAVAARRQVGWVDLRNASFEGPDAAERVEAWSRSWPGGLVVLDNAETAVGVVEQVLDRIARVAPDVQDRHHQPRSDRFHLVGPRAAGVVRADHR